MFKEEDFVCVISEHFVSRILGQGILKV